MFVGSQHRDLDKNFLKQLDSYPQREVYAKIISLNWNEEAISEITGNIQSGSISVDGASKTRRTCSLTITTDELRSQINNADWGLNTKFVVLIGLRNYIDKNYDDIIWFQQGIFIITSFSQSYSDSGLTISIQGKDKMCLLDGSVGGALFADHDFGAIDVISDDGSVSKEYITIKEIVKNAVHEYALEPFENIIINDLTGAVELLNYRVNDANLFIYDVSSSKNFTSYTSQMLFDKEDQDLAIKFQQYAPKDLNDNYRLLEPFQIRSSNLWYRIIKYVEYGETVGYRETELTYAGDLIVNAGGAVTSAFDNIINMLGEFEYYYDVYGRFIFQRKKTYHNVAWIGAVTNEDEDTYYDTINNSLNSYEFNTGYLISQYSNSPVLTNIKNDFVIWGTNSNDYPFHLRYAIDDKPTSYTSLSNGITYKIKKEAGDPSNVKIVDWRELIYRMAEDNMKSQGYIQQLTMAMIRNDANTFKRYKFDASINISESNCYYYDIEDKIWKTPNSQAEIIELQKSNKMLFGIVNNNNSGKFVLKSHAEEIAEWQTTWNTGYDNYYADMLAFWRLIYDCRTIDEIKDASDLTDGEKDKKEKDYSKWQDNFWWNPDLIDYYEDTVHFVEPEAMLFWIDFIGEGTQLEKYKTSVIGRRPQVVEDSDIKAILYKDTPEVLFVDPTNNKDTENKIGVSYVRLNLTPGLMNYFLISSQGKSAKEVLDNMVYDYTYYQETVQLTLLSIYYLEPNTRVTIYDEATGIYGSYLIKSFNYNLAYDGTMSLTASKIAEEIL